MAGNIFVSHRDAEEDIELAKALREGLKERKHRVFLATDDIEPGDEWSKRIEEELAAADLFVVLLSRSLAENPEMVAEEVTTATDLWREGHRPRVVPVRMEASVVDLMPYNLRAKLKPYQQETWAGPDDTFRLVLSLDHLIREPARPAARSWSESRILDDSRPPDAEPESRNGDAPLRPPGSSDPRFYVRRPRAEREAQWRLSQHGEPLVVVGPENVGKTCFLNHLLQTFREPTDGHVRINLEYLGEAAMGSLDSLLEGFGYEFVDHLQLEDEALAQAWSRRGPATRKLTRFVEETALPAVSGRCFLAIDRADTMLETDYAQDLFGVLRRWAESGETLGDPWDRLRLVLVVATEPNQLVQRVHSSPFNLSEPVWLGDLREDQVQQMARLYGLDWSPSEIRRLMDLVGGQPYLVRKAFYEAAAGGKSIDELLAEARANGLFSDHLKARLHKVRRDRKLCDAVRQVLDDEKAEIDLEIAQLLERAGLLKPGRRGGHRLRYRLYEQYFREHIR